MVDGPEKKRKKLTAALKEAIGAHSQKTEENIEKPIALALISGNKEAEVLLNKIQASRRPQAILQTTLNVCKEKKSSANVGEAFLLVFRKYFSVLGIDSALTCWKLLEDHLSSSESINGIKIANEFIGMTTILGHGFGKLIQAIKSGVPALIQSFWKQGRRADALSISYSFINLIIAEHVYGEIPESKSPEDFWKEEVLTEKSLRKDFGLKMISSLIGNADIMKSLASLTEVDSEHIELLSTVFLNHIEFFMSFLSESVCCEFLANALVTNLQKKELRKFVNRLSCAEISINSVLYNALVSLLRPLLESSNSSLYSIDNLDSLKLKEVAKTFPSTFDGSSKEFTPLPTTTEKLHDITDFIVEYVKEIEDAKYSTAFFLLSFNIAGNFDSSDCWKKLQLIAQNLSNEALEKLIKSGKGASNALLEEVVEILKGVKKTRDEKSAEKFVNRSSSEVNEKLESSDFSVSEAIVILEGVHTSETRKEVFDSVVKFVEEIPGGESLDELQLYSRIIEMYGGSPLESLAMQIIFSRVAVDGWTEMDRVPGTERSEESWFSVLVPQISLLEVIMKSSKNSIVKSFTALYCQLFSQVLKNTQKFVKNSSDATASPSVSPAFAKLSVLRRHKLIQDVSRLVDAMKRHESYFSMLAASIIGDAVFYGSDNLLAMSKLHSLADKNTSALLATNLPVVERTRYKKFLSTITKASKRVY